VHHHASCPVTYSLQRALGHSILVVSTNATVVNSLSTDFDVLNEGIGGKGVIICSI
jgi:hypothetical protein